jgi:hypothetical protein
MGKIHLQEPCLFKDYPSKGALGKIDCGKLTLEMSSLASPKTKIILPG